MKTLVACLFAAACLGCATPASNTAPVSTLPAAPLPAAPVLQLPPVALGRSLALQQQITIDYQGQRRDLQALLEADAQHTQLAALAGGQVVARLDWDGKALKVFRSPMLPEQMKPERILSDLQLSLWPAAAIVAALPAGWTLDADARERTLRFRGQAVVTVAYPDARTVMLEQLRDGYRLRIVSNPAGESP
jgi:uncharacterized protein YbdZ (MbtH family)